MCFASTLSKKLHQVIQQSSSGRQEKGYLLPGFLQCLGPQLYGVPNTLPFWPPVSLVLQSLQYLETLFARIILLPSLTVLWFPCKLAQFYLSCGLSVYPRHTCMLDHLLPTAPGLSGHLQGGPRGPTDEFLQTFSKCPLLKMQGPVQVVHRAA